MQLLVSEIFADRICQLCASDLNVFANLREDLISKQKNLYQLAGLDESHFNFSSCVPANADYSDVIQEETSEFDMNFETIEQDDGIMYEGDEQSQDPETEMLLDEESASAFTVFRIEKVDDETGDEKTLIDDDDGGSASFDYFEEIVGNDSNEQKYFENTSRIKEEL